MLTVIKNIELLQGRDTIVDRPKLNVVMDVQEIIFLKDGQHYLLIVTRSGSSFTDWYYTYEDATEVECYPVEPVEVTKIKWVLKKEG